jgi:hypothetical protein
MAGVRMWPEGAGLADLIGRDHLFDDVVGATVAYLNLHATGVDARRQVRSELMELIAFRRRDPALDAVGERVIGEQRQLAPGPDVGP